MPDKQPNEVPEFAHTDKAARRRELMAAGARAHEHLDKIKKNLKLPGLVSVEAETQALIGTEPCPDRYVVRRLLAGAGQQIQKEVLETWVDGNGVCQRFVYKFGIQFTGYSSYCMSFEKDPRGTNLFANFFRDVAGYGVNLNRTMLFLKESYENPDHPENCHRLLLEGQPLGSPGVGVNPLYLDNLARFVGAAKSRGVVVQVCLFMHHAVAASSNCDMPPPVRLSGTPYQRYKAFLNTSSAYLPTQLNFINAVVNRLKPHWNVIYEVGNELRVPQPDAQYNEDHLRAWVDWVAQRIRANDTTHLIGTSTGADNERKINSVGLLQYCSFHQGQWKADLGAACDRANGYGNRHLIADDDGDTRHLPDVTRWVKQALEVRGGCRGSYNHKGATVANAYYAGWIDEPNRKNPTYGTPRQSLEAFRQARQTAQSGCARTE